MANFNEIVERVRREREAQTKKWGVQRHLPITWSAILSEECGEVAKAALESNHSEYVRELVQVAAVAFAALEAAVAGGRCGVAGCPCCALLAPDTIPEEADRG